MENVDFYNFSDQGGWSGVLITGLKGDSEEKPLPGIITAHWVIIEQSIHVFFSFKVGGTLSTTVAALAEISPIIPTLIFGSMAITSGLITFILPGETIYINYPQVKTRPLSVLNIYRIYINVFSCRDEGQTNARHH